MSGLYDFVIAPFADYAFMRLALAASLALSVAAAPLGVILVLRRMSLIGDAISHAILPGVAISFLVAGFSLWLMALGGVIAGLLVVLAAGAVSRVTVLKEDASLAAFYLTSLALGVMAASSAGSGIDLVHLLFGSILAVDPAGLILAATLASVTLVCMAIIYRPLLVESFDPVFMRAAGGHGALIHSILLALVVVNLVAGFQVMGTLMSVGLMMLPAAAARLWCANVWPMMITAGCAAALCSFAGLIISFHGDWPSGPAIVLVCSGFYFVSLMVGTQQGLLWRVIQGRHIHDPHNPVVTPSRQPKQ